MNANRVGMKAKWPQWTSTKKHDAYSVHCNLCSLNETKGLRNWSCEEKDEKPQVCFSRHSFPAKEATGNFLSSDSFPLSLRSTQGNCWI